MKRLLFALLVLAFLVGGPACDGEETEVTSPQAPVAAAPGTSGQQQPAGISWDQAINHVGEHATVCGLVVGTMYAKDSRGQPTFLNIGRDYPDPDRFTVLIWGENRGNFSPPPEDAYAGKTICATGLIETYRGTAQIEARTPSGIQVAP